MWQQYEVGNAVPDNAETKWAFSRLGHGGGGYPIDEANRIFCVMLMFDPLVKYESTKKLRKALLRGEPGEDYLLVGDKSLKLLQRDCLAWGLLSMHNHK